MSLEILDYKFNWKSAGTSVHSDPRLSEPVTPSPVGVKLPLSPGTGRSGLFEMHFNPIDQIKDDFRNLVLTNHFERLGNPLYGANLRPLTTEYSALDHFEAAAMDRIQQAVLNFMPIIDLDDFSSTFIKDTDPALLRIDMSIKYNIPKLGAMGNILTVSFTVI